MCDYRLKAYRGRYGKGGGGNDRGETIAERLGRCGEGANEACRYSTTRNDHGEVGRWGEGCRCSTTGNPSNCKILNLV